jgi:hypothetical protein
MLALKESNGNVLVLRRLSLLLGEIRTPHLLTNFHVTFIKNCPSFALGAKHEKVILN